MFYSNQQNINKKQYQQFLSIVGSISNLFSDSNVPYLYYRIAEKLFCRAFDAEDLSRNLDFDRCFSKNASYEKFIRNNT